MGKLCVLTKTNKETSNWLTGFFYSHFLCHGFFLWCSGAIWWCQIKVSKTRMLETQRFPKRTTNHPQSSTFLYDFSKCHVVCGRNLYLIYHSVCNIIKYSDLNLLWVKILDYCSESTHDVNGFRCRM